MAYYIGTDIGGTFTDCVVLDEGGNIVVSKSPSTPPNFADGLMNSLLDAASQLGLPLSELLANTRLFPHGCTVATNTLINQSGAKVGAITTKGFEETLYIMRGSAYCQGLPVEDWYHKPQNERPFDLVPLSDIVGVTERIDKAGEEIVALNEEEVRKAAEFLVRERRCEAIMIGFLWSFVNSAHEDRAKEIVEGAFPGIRANSSSEVVALIGEYERFSTAALNCYLRPDVERYVHDLNGRLSERELAASFLIMQAHGGLIPWKSAARRAVGMLQSGPAGGVIAGKTIAALIGSPSLITADMGGTSFDISLVIDGNPRYTTKSYHLRHVVAAPMVDIESIGAGGGSIAYVEGKVCKVGPHSTGADPGPVCYSKGGKQPTVTDANLVLGYLNPDYFLGGKMKLDLDAARHAIKEQIASPLGLDVAEAAYGIHRIVNAHMSDAIRFHVLHRGYDPRNFDLLLFGGATPVHAVGIGEDLEVKSIVIPLAGMATVLSAFGIVSSDVIRTYSASTSLPLVPESMDTLETQFRELEERGLAELAVDGFRRKDVLLERVANIRYHLQLTEVDVELSGDPFDKDATRRIVERFDRRYAELYGENAGYKEAGRDVISQFVRAIARTPKVRLKKEEQNAHSVAEMLKGKREVYFPDIGFTPADIYDGDRLPAHSRISGPAVLEMGGTTVLVPQRYRAEFDGYRNIHLRRGE
jgi:N-methylhydantoinase A